MSDVSEEVRQAFERGPVIGGEMTQAVARLERRYEELERGAEAFAARLWRALRPDTTEAPPSPDALVEEVGRVVAETVRLRRSIAIADEAYRVRGDLCDAMRGRIADLEALASGPRGDL